MENQARELKPGSSKATPVDLAKGRISRAMSFSVLFWTVLVYMVLTILLRCCFSVKSN